MKLARLWVSGLVVGSFLSSCVIEEQAQPKPKPVKPEPEPIPEPEPECETSDDCTDVNAPICDAGFCVLPPGSELGLGDGSPSSVTLTVIHTPDREREPTDLQFDPLRPNELWVVNRWDDSVILIKNPGKPESSSERLRDPAASHFMDRPPAIAFGANDTFGVCSDGNNGGNDFTGAALFSSNPGIFAVATPGGLGSHLDMLHSTTFCRGIAHQRDNVYWVFNSNKGSIDRYDFVADHGPGNDDHSDGIISRYVPGTLLAVDNASSHLAFHPDGRRLFIADTGNSRIAVLDTMSGTPGATFSGLEPADRTMMDGAALTDLVVGGALVHPSGIEVRGDLVYVSDYNTSYFHAFDLQGKLVRSLNTGLAQNSLSGFTFGPDGRIYFADLATSVVYRIDPKI